MSNTTIDTKVPHRFKGDPLSKLLAQREIQNLEQSSKLDQLENTLSDLHATVAKLGGKQGVKVKPLSKIKEAPSLPKKLTELIHKTSSGILKYFEQYFTGPQDDIPECDMPVAPFPPKTGKAEDILASIRSYADAPDTEANYFTGVGLKENSATLQSLHESKKAEVLNFAIVKDVTQALLEQISKIDKRTISTPTDLLKNKNTNSLIALMDLVHCILFDYKLALPENLLNIGIDEEKDLAPLQKVFVEYLHGPKASVPKELVSLLQLPDFGDEDRPNTSFSSVLIHWTLLYSIEQFQKSTKSLDSLQEILETNFYSLLKLKQSIKPNSDIKPKMDLVMKKVALKEIENFTEASADLNLAQYLADKPDLLNFIRNYRMELVIGKLNEIRNDLLHEEEPDAEDSRTASASSALRSSDLSKRELLKDEDLKNLLPIIYSLITFSSKDKAELDQAYADSFDERKVEEGKTKLQLATIRLDNFINGLTYQGTLSHELPMVLADLMHDYVLLDAQHQIEAENKLRVLIGKYLLKNNGN